MPKSRSLFVTLCQQASAVALVGVVGTSAAGVVVLDIRPPAGAPFESQPRSQVRPGTPVAEDRAVVPTAPVEPTVREVALTDERSAEPTRQSRVQHKSSTADRSPQEIVIFSRAEPVSGYATVGVTWDGDQELAEDDVAFSVRTRTDGAWSPWQEMHYDAEHGADMEEVERGQDLRAGTEPVVVGEVDQVQVRATSFTGETPRGLAVDLVDPGEEGRTSEQSPAIEGQSTRTEAAGGEGELELSAKRLSAPRPKIFSRAQWGADERLRDKRSLRYGEIHAGFVHHTVNANNYSRADVPAILRGIYAYHTKSRGWSDVGYNFLVDRFGRIWEGRAGGVGRPVVGAHTLGYNDDSFAMSAIGNFETARPSAAMVNAYGALMAWKLSLHDVDAAATRVFVTSRYFQAINGHRDAGSTACPGRYLYEKLPQIRRKAAKIQQTGTTPAPQPDPEPEPEPEPPTKGTPLDGNLSGSVWPDLVVRDAATKRVMIVPTGGQLGFASSDATAATGWAKADLVAAAGDIDGDRRPDVVARFSGTGKARDYTVTRSGALRPLGHVYTRFRGLGFLTGVGDLNGDRKADLVGRRGGKLLLFAGRGNGTFSRAKLLAADWRRFDVTVGVDDLDGDGRRDLLARAGGTLHLVRGTARGIATPRALPGSFAGYDLLAGRGDVTGDGRPDLLVRAARNGLVYAFPGNGAGGLGARIGGWTGFESVRWLGLAGQVNGSNHADALALAGRSLKVLTHNGRSNLGSVVDTRAGVARADLVLNAGDWNGDGRGDVVTRDASSGVLQLRPVRKDGRLAAAQRIGGPGWAQVRHVTAVGDVTGDGRPDLAGLQAGEFKVFHGNATRGIRRSTVLEAPFKATGLVNVGLWDGDALPDVGYRRKDGTLWVVPSSGGDAVQVARNLRRYDWIRGLGDLDGDGRSDVLVRSRNGGDLSLLRRQGDGFAAPRVIATGFDRYDLG